MRVKVICEVDTYNEDERGKGLDTPKILVRSHNIHKDRVHLRIGDEDHIVIARDIIDAIQRASSSGLF